MTATILKLANGQAIAVINGVATAPFASVDAAQAFIVKAEKGAQASARFKARFEASQVVANAERAARGNGWGGMVGPVC